MLQQVLATLSYSHVFRFPLTSEELYKRLVTSAVTDNGIPHQSRLQEDEKITPAAVKRSLRELGEAKSVHQHKGYFSLLALPQLESMVKSRQVKQVIATKKWQEAGFVGRMLSWVPGVVGVAVTGSLAVNNPVSADDDIDFLIVTTPQTLWLVRPAVILIAYIFGKRRSWQGEEQNSWCFNAWMTTDSLALHDVYDDFKPNLYHAYELLQATWLVDRGYGGVPLKQLLVNTNQWVRDFISPSRWRGKITKRKVPALTDQGLFRLFSPILGVINKFFYFLQLQYMKPHMTTEKVSEKVAFFHPRPTRKLTISSWVTQYKDVSKSLVQTVEPWYLSSRVEKIRNEAKEKGKKVVLATGVFDLLHKEHKNFLSKAKKAGDVLIVGIESDSRVKKMKGEGRPINDQSIRSNKVAALRGVDVAFILPEAFSSPADHEALIAIVGPDILAVSSHTAHLDKKQAVVAKYGGELRVVHQHNPAISTTLLLKSGS